MKWLKGGSWVPWFRRPIYIAHDSASGFPLPTEEDSDDEVPVCLGGGSQVGVGEEFSIPATTREQRGVTRPPRQRQRQGNQGDHGRNDELLSNRHILEQMQEEQRQFFQEQRAHNRYVARGAYFQEMYFRQHMQSSGWDMSSWPQDVHDYYTHPPPPPPP